MTEKTQSPEDIGSYEARIHWGRLLDEVSAGASYVISKRQKKIAALVPLEEWTARQGEEDSAEARELDALVRQLQERHETTLAALDDAFAELARTRETLAALRADRAQAGQPEAARHAGG